MNEDQVREINQAKARLEKWRDTFQYYPPIPEEERPIEKTIIYQEEYWTNRQWDKVQQLEGKVLHLQRKVNDSLKKKRREVYVIK